MFLDLSDSIIDNKVEIARPPARHIGSKSKGTVIYNYKEETHNQFLNHRIYEKATKLHEESLQAKVLEQFEVTLNNLDQQITQIMLSAEKNQCKRKVVSRSTYNVYDVSILSKAVQRITK